MLHDERHDVVFVGYLARGTAIQAYVPRGRYVDLDGVRIDIRARAYTLFRYSAHGGDEARACGALRKGNEWVGPGEQWVTRTSFEKCRLHELVP